MTDFNFVAIRSYLAEIQQIPYLTLEIKRQGHYENRPKSNQAIYVSGLLTLPKLKENLKVVWNLSGEQ